MIVVPDRIWAEMLNQFAKRQCDVEQICYFDGILFAAGEGVVTTLTIPNARVQHGNFHVPTEAMSQAGRHLREHRLRRLAQVHTHPDAWTGHSPYDDAWAYSQLPGAISIVLPHYARHRPSLTEAGVHVRTPSGWRPLPPAELVDQIRVAPAFFDFRPAMERAHARPHLESPRKRSWWAALAFWLHKSG